MGHTVIFQDFDKKFPLSEIEIRDLIDLFYRWEDTIFYINNKVARPRARGEHNSDWQGHHYISLARRSIENTFKEKGGIGGNYPAPTLKTAAAFTLVHELTHANQTKFHKGEKGFYGKMNGVNALGNARMKHYWGRACEREARQFVDEHLSEICAYFAVDPPKARMVRGMVPGQDEVLGVADILCECEEVTLDDIKDELRISNVLTPSNFKMVMNELKSRGFKIKTS